MSDQETACPKGNTNLLNLSLRPDERKQLASCRRNTLGTGFVFGGLTWFATRVLLKKTMIQNTFIGRNPMLVYSVAIGVAVYQGMMLTTKSCFQGLASLENSRFSEIGKRALEMREDKRTLSKLEFLEKYPPHIQKKLFDPTSFVNATPPLTDLSTSASNTPESPQPSMFHPAKDSEPSNKPKSFQEMQNLNRSKQDSSVSNFPEYKPKLQQPRSPTKQVEDSNLPPSGLEGKSKPKRNEYGDVVYED